MSDIPTEVFREILLRLPAASLFRFRAVCKEWRRFIDDPSFIKSHTSNQLSSNTLLIRNTTGDTLYLISLDSLNFSDYDRQMIDAIPVTQLTCRGVARLLDLPVSSCNGMILISTFDRCKVWAIWNPLTGECHELPGIATSTFLLAKGFGYDYATDDYKVVSTDDLDTDDVFVKRTLVYSMKSGCWRKIKDCPYEFRWEHGFEGDIEWVNEGVFLNGKLHWASWKKIIAFDLATEDYGQLPLPPSRSGDTPSGVNLDALGGCLIVSFYYYIHLTEGCLEGWVMNDYGVEKSWTKLFSLGESNIPGGLSRLRPVAYLKGKNQVLLQHRNGFFSVDIVDDSVKKVTTHGLSGISSAQICPGSLFRLDDGGSSAAAGVKKKKKRKIERKMVDIRLKFCVRDVDDRYCSDTSCRSADSNEDEYVDYQYYSDLSSSSFYSSCWGEDKNSQNLKKLRITVSLII